MDCAGVIITFADNDPDLATVAAPVFDHGSQLTGAIGVSLPIYRATVTGIKNLVAQVLGEAILITQQLGGDASRLSASPVPGYMFIRDGKEMKGELESLVSSHS